MPLPYPAASYESAVADKVLRKDRVKIPVGAPLKGHARPDTARGNRDPHYLEQYRVDGGRLPRELGQGMHEGGHTGRPYVPRYTRVGRDAPGRGWVRGARNRDH